MSLIPYPITVVRSDDDGSGKNIVPFASVSILDSVGSIAALKSDSGGTVLANPFTLDANGQKQIWVEPGIYQISISGGPYLQTFISSATTENFTSGEKTKLSRVLFAEDSISGALPNAATREGTFLTFGSGGAPVAASNGLAVQLIALGSNTEKPAANLIVLNGIDADSAAVRLALNVADGAQVNVPTNLAVTGSGDSRTITSSTGDDAALPISSASNAGLMSIARTAKLDSLPDSTALNTLLGDREIIVNKRTSLASPDNTGYPTTLTVASAIAAAMAGETPMGAWNASTNTPALASSVGTAGHWYEVSVSGTTNLNGENDWEVGDKATFNGIIWTRIPANSVRSVDGLAGAVILNYDTVADAAAASLPVGAKYSTKGVDSVGDGFGEDYLVFSSSSVAADGFNVIAHADGKFGVRQPVKNYYLYSKSAVRSRAPMRSDFKDFNTGNLPAWVCDDGVYAVNRVSSTYSTWIKDRSFRPLIGDMATPSAIWWLSKVVAAYAGQCINVTNETLATSSDIGFDQFGNLDTLALAKFLRGSRGLVNTWYDQSGNGHNLTSSGANRPVISSVKKVGSLYGVIFETGTIYNGVTIPDQFMTIPSSLTGTSNSVTMGCLCSFASSLRDAPIIELAGSDSNFTAIGKRNASGSSGFNVYQNSAQRVNSLHQPKIADNFFMASIGASTINYWGNDTVAVAGTSLSGVSFAGGKVGGTTDIFVNGSSVAQNGGGIIAGIFVSSSVHSVSLQRQLFRACAEQYKITPQARANIVFDGDSITEGAGATNFDTTSSNINERAYYPVRVYNVGQGGGTTSSQNTNRSRWETQIYKSGAPMNLIVLGIGTNNLNAGDSSATVISGIQDYIDAVKLTGYEIVLCSILPRAAFISTAKETERLAVNDHLKNNWQSMGAIGYVNYDNEGTMGSNTFVVNTAYYFDGTHPTTDGYALLATYISHVIDPIIGRLISRS